MRSAGHTLFRHLFFPSMIALAVISWAFQVEGTQALKAARWPIDFATAVLFVSIFAIWCAEQAFPLHREWNYRLTAKPLLRAALGWRRLARDLCYLFLVTLAGSFVITWVAQHVEAAFETHGFGFGLTHLWPERAPFPAKVLLAFMVVEFFSYWFHRLAHRVKVFWHFHQTHHVVTELTSLKALRTHPIDNVFFYIARTVPLLLVGAGSAEVIAAVFFGATLSLLSHANVDVAEKPFGLFLNYPSYHAVHHSVQLAQSNTNFGCHTVIFDRLFGTFAEVPVTTEPPVLGVYPLRPRSLWQELVMPPRSET